MKSIFLRCEYLHNKWIQCMKQKTDFHCDIYIEDMKKNNCHDYGFVQYNEKEFLFILWELLY